MITPLLIAMLALNSPASDLNDSIALLDRLDTTIISVEYTHQTIRSVVEDLNGRLPAQLWADWKALERIGVYADRRIDLRLSGSSASTILSALTLLIGDDLDKPVYETHAGQIVLTTLAGSGPFKVTAVYDVRDLLANEALVNRLRNENVPADDPPQHAQGGQPDDNDNDDPSTAEPEENRIPAPKPLTPGEKLMLFITDHVDPEAWINFGGNRGLITELNGVLMVTATPSTHRRLRSAIRSLQAAIPSSVTFEAAIVDLPRAKLQALTRESGNDTAALARSILLDADATRLWQTTDSVAVDQALKVESEGVDQSVHVELAPTFDESTGLLRVSIAATVAQGADKRSLKSVALLGSDSGAASLELPASKPATTIRLIVLIVTRR